MKNIFNLDHKMAWCLFIFTVLIATCSFSCSSRRAAEQISTPAEEKNFLTTKNLPQFWGKEFFGVLPTELLGVLTSTGGVDSLVASADTVRVVPQKNSTVLVYADKKAPTSAFTYGPDPKGKYVLMGRPSALKDGLPTFIFEVKEYYLLSGGEGIVINPRGSMRILPGWKPEPQKKN